MGQNGLWTALIILLVGGIILFYFRQSREGMENADTTTVATTTDTTSNNKGSNNYDNYNHYLGTSSASVYYGPDGGTAKVIDTPTSHLISITSPNGITETYSIQDPTASIVVYYAPSGGSARIITGSGGKTMIEVTTSHGEKIIYTPENHYNNTSQDNTLNQYDGETNYTGADYSTAYIPPSSNSSSSSSAYSSTYSGIPRSQIPEGDKDLYILKSQVVPPVCPKCPDPIVPTHDTTDNSKCPPCPACARCPEPSFECKKVPNYSAFSSSTMPIPVLNEFSGFGM